MMQVPLGGTATVLVLRLKSGIMSSLRKPSITVVLNLGLGGSVPSTSIPRFTYTRNLYDSMDVCFTILIKSLYNLTRDSCDRLAYMGA